MHKQKLILLDENDNVLIVRSSISIGDSDMLDTLPITFHQQILIGHKIARKNIFIGEIIYKYGVPIGSAISDIQLGEHIHLHNMKSDYLPTYTLD